MDFDIREFRLSVLYRVICISGSNLDLAICWYSFKPRTTARLMKQIISQWVLRSTGDEQRTHELVEYYIYIIGRR